MKKFYILLFALYLVASSMAQWVPQNSGTTNSFYSVYFTDTVTGYAVGGYPSGLGFEDGTILKTINGGTNWIFQVSGAYPLFKSVYFTNANTGYVVGSYSYFGGSFGIILKTSNGGATWDSLSSRDHHDFLSVYFTDENTGFIVGSFNIPERESSGFILKTMDGGSIWTRTDVDKSLVSVHFHNATTGYAAGYQKIYKTTDGGLTWVENLSIEPVSEVFNSVYFTDINTGYAVSRGYYSDSSRIYKTNNGGINWVNQSFGVRLSSFYFTDPSTGYIVGDSGTILKTTDGGTNWTSQSSGTFYNLARVYFTNANTGYAVGDSGTILKTTNGGGPLGISEQQQTNNIKIYPNPANDNITIEALMTGDTRLTILNVNGQKLIEKNINDQKSHIDISNLHAGVFFVKVENRNSIEVRKLIKQ